MKIKSLRFRAIIAAMFVFVQPSQALNERIVHDPSTGIALFGYDPLSYFVNIKPKIGVPSHETYINGVSWRFYSQGNKRVFERNPEEYQPQFGGYDVVALAQEKISISDPLYYLLYKSKLYLFASAATRVAFSVEPDYFIAEATQKWPKMKVNLSKR